LGCSRRFGRQPRICISIAPGAFPSGIAPSPRARAGRKPRQLVVKLRSTKILRPHENNGFGTYHVNLAGRTIFRSGEMELHRSSMVALFTLRLLRGHAHGQKGQVGASFQGLGSGRSTARCAVAWGVVVLSADGDTFGGGGGVRRPIKSSPLLLASLACIHVPCTTLVHRANYEVVPTGTASA
jgi:hypothetical protein